MHSTPQHTLDTRAIELASEARQIASNARDECGREYIRLWARLDKQDLDSDAKHDENVKKFDRLFRALYIAVGIGMAASALLSAASPAIYRLLHP